LLSFWEKKSFTHYDIIIIGSGIVGLSTAASILEANPTKKVLILERGIFPTGASTKNAGFACFGSLSEIVSDLKKSSEDEVISLVERRWKGLQLLRKRLGDEKIDYLNYGGYELMFNENLNLLHKIDEVNKLLKPIFQEDVYKVSDEKITQFGFSDEKVKSIVFNKFEAQIDTGKMMSNLLRYVTSLGASLITGAEVKEVVKHSSKVVLNSGVEFFSDKIVLCTNAFSKQFLSDEYIEPGRGQVLVTKPVKNLKFKGVFHFDEGFYYFRNFEDRVIFGGGRNLDLHNEATTDFGNTPLILYDLNEKLRTIILPNQEFKVDQTWSGIMAFGETKKPILKKIDENIYVGIRLGGMGVALGSLLGEELSEMIKNN
jgi:glycine/D-amino acid oxidase-like deaminating enzyme